MPNIHWGLRDTLNPNPNLACGSKRVARLVLVMYASMELELMMLMLTLMFLSPL
jgi:hypothetical protein